MTRDCDFCRGTGMIHGYYTVPCPVCRLRRQRPEPALAPRIAEYLRVFETEWLWPRRKGGGGR